MRLHRSAASRARLRIPGSPARSYRAASLGLRAIHPPVVHANAISLPHAGVEILREGLVAAVVHADAIAELLRLGRTVDALLDLVPQNAARERAADRRGRTSGAVSDLISEHAAGDRTADRADARALAVRR